MGAILDQFAILKTLPGVTPVSCVVSISDNVDVSVDGIRSSVTTMRSNLNAGLSENVDATVMIPSAGFEAVDQLKGRPITVTQGVKVRSMRIMAVREHMMGDIAVLMLAEQDRVS